MIWRKKREVSVSEATSKSSFEGSAAKSGAGAGVHEAGQTAGRPVQGGAPSNSDRLDPTLSGRELGFQSTPEAHTAQRRYAIPRSYRVWGRLVSARPISIQGEMAEGELVSRLVTVLPGGSVRAATNADIVQVAGVVEGDIHARLVDVSSLGELKGAVSAAQIRVLPGATLAGAALKIG